MADIDYTPPDGVRSACRRGLELAPDHGGAGLTDGAKGRARAMAAGKAITADTAKRIKAFHARHTYPKEANPPSPGYVAWKLWGGDAGKAWAEKLVRQGEAVSKGRPPMGAAFAHARARSTTGSMRSQRRLANSYLRSQGRAPIGKGVLDRLRALSYDERADMGVLEGQGFTAEEARALAMAGSKTRKSVFKGDYSAAYLARARGALDDAARADVHVRARGSAGGVAARRARRAKNDPGMATRLARIKQLREELATLEAEVDKSAPTLSELTPGGVSAAPPGPVGPRMPRATRRRVDKAADALVDGAFGGRVAIAKRASVPVDDEMLDAAFSRVAKEHVVATDGAKTPYEDPVGQGRYMDAQRLLLGMDYELANGADNLDEARTKASRVLAQNMGSYDNVRPGPQDQRKVGGLDLDLGSGAARDFGCLGVDTYPYDHGTVIHDLRMGIPFPDGSARSVRLVNALDDIIEPGASVMPLMQQIQWALAIGGRLTYIGSALGGRVDWKQLPGLRVVESQVSEGPGPQVQTLTAERVTAKLPAVYGADTQYLGVPEQDATDLRRVQQANLGSSPTAGLLMANLVGKSEAVQVEAPCVLIKKDAMRQICYGTVLSPGEVDSQNDFMEADDIAEAAHGFLVNARTLGIEHKEGMQGADVVESYVAPCDLNFSGEHYGPQSVPAGSWILGVRVQDPAQWAAVMDGSFTGFSVGGYGERE